MKTFDFSHHGQESIEIQNACYHCGESNTITVDAAALTKWGEGAYIQTAFSDLHADERELIQTGIHPECWNNMFPEEED